MDRQQFKAEVVALVGKGHVFVTAHLNRDHPERRVSQAQIQKCLTLGTVQNDPYLNRYGNWQSDFFRHLAGEELTVVAALDWETDVIVITAY